MDKRAKEAVRWWGADAIGAAQVQQEQLEAEVGEWQANVDTWVKADVLGKPERRRSRGGSASGWTRAPAHSRLRDMTTIA